jgi:Tfp pilus assembly protein PilN
VIKINLKPSASDSKALVGGLDVSKIDFKKLLIAVLVYFVLDVGKEYYFDGENQVIDQEIAKYNKELKTLNKRLGGYKDLNDKVQNLKNEKQSLDKRFEVVKQIINTRTSPMKILHYMAQNIPKDLWLSSLELSGNKLLIEGNSLSYKSIGNFIENLKKSIFFDQGINLDDYKTVQEQNGQRLENFKISAVIIRYE